MNPDQQNSPNQEQQPQLQPVLPNATPVAPPTAPQPLPATQTPVVNGVIPEKAVKKIKATSIAAIILGFLMIVVGLGVAYFINVAGALNCLFGIAYLVFGFKLRATNAPLSSTLSSLKMLHIAVVINLIVSLVTGNGAGILPLLVVLFAMGAYKQLFEAGLTTSRAPFTAKAIVK
jgi:uncharacterized membrane protein